MVLADAIAFPPARQRHGEIEHGLLHLAAGRSRAFAITSA